MTHILIVEDDQSIAQSLKMYLESSHFQVSLYCTGFGVIDVIEQSVPDLVILDINLPGMNGIEICKKIRKNFSFPVIMLTARNSEIDRITGLEIGADDYIAKPFSPRELLARIHTIIRRVDFTKTSGEEVKILEFSGLVVDISKKIVSINGEKIFFTTNEFELLAKIMQEDGKIVTRDVLMTEVMGYDKYIYDRTLDTHIKNLRKKLGKKNMILTVRGAGYRLNK